MLNLLLTLLVFGLVVWVAYWVLDQIRLPETPKRIIQVILAIVFVVFLLRILGFGAF